MKITKLKGVLDYYGYDMELFNRIKDTSKKICSTYGFSEVVTPIIEPVEVFLRTIGDESDIVGKEMYVFKDKGDRTLALKPESTAAVMRMYVENKMYAEPGLKKFYYFSPNFRYDRPQAGRYRQFYQFGVEAIGLQSPYLDAEVIGLGYKILITLGIKDVVLNINTLGSDDTRKNYMNVLRNYFSDKLDLLCEDCKRRYNTNILRMLDCKVDSNNPVMDNIPKIQDYLSESDDEYFSTLLKTLDKLNISYVVNPKIVRGLDYYTNDIFEFIYNKENSPLNGLAILAGGRYNNLAQEFDGPQSYSIGFGMGVERIIIALKEIDVKPEKVCNTAVIISLSENAKLQALKLASTLRDNNYVVEMDYLNNNLKPQFKLCDRINPDYILIIGDDEINEDKIQIKIVKEQTQKEMKIDELKEALNLKEGVKYEK